VVVTWLVLGVLGALTLGLIGWGLATPGPATAEPPSEQRDRQARDGTWVASEGERLIANWLDAHGIGYRYEPELAGGLTPDFHIVDTDVIIEYWGMSGETDYEDRMEEKMGIYEEHGYDVVGLFPTHTHEMGDVLERELGERGVV